MMGFNCGIVGLPNVGKSTLFNVLTQASSAEAANYPFCTIDPNIGCVAVPDARLETLAKIAASKKIVPTHVDLVDIAGLVKGASKGEGLGNQFLGHIRATDAIIHLVRCFENDDITHVEGQIDPVRDFQTVEIELMLADMDGLEKRLERVAKKLQTLPKEARAQYELMAEALALLRDGNAVQLRKPKFAETPDLNLLSSKQVLVVCNVAEDCAVTGNQHSEAMAQYAAEQGLRTIIISAAIEADIAALPTNEERKEFLASIGLDESGLAKVIRAGYDSLNLETFFTAGPIEARAWAIVKGTKAPDAAGKIHTDFQRGFICAETIHYDDYVACGGEPGARSAGKLRIEGKEYVVCDGDVMLFRFNV